MYIHTYIHILFITGRLPWQPAGIKFTQWVSGQESAFSPLHERTMRWIEKKMIDTFGIVTTFSISMRSLGRSNYARRLQERKLVFFVCHAWSACAWGT